jgi:alpha-tubulin suppressor-like RCC1 family protein
MRVLIVFLFSVLTVNCFAFYVEANKASGGEDHILVSFSNDTLFGAGYNRDGQLGVNDRDDKFVLAQTYSGAQSLTETFIQNVLSFDAGWQHSICCDENGYCYTMGINASYVLGIGSMNTGLREITPAQVLSGEQSDPNAPHTYLENIIQVSAGRSGTHSLAIEETIDPQTQEASYRAFAWGNNSHGQLGIDDTGAESTPCIVLAGEQQNDPNGNPYFADVLQVSAGEFHSMLLDDSGNVFCMGDDADGQIGNGSATGYATVPNKVLSGEQSDTNTYLENIVAINAGWQHCMALEDLDPEDDVKNGRVYTWGSNHGGYYSSGGGRLGNGEYSNSSWAAGDSTVDKPEPVRVKSGQQNIDPNGLVNIVAISAGDSHCLALDNKGNVWSWGDNNYGQLGVGSQTNHYTPVKVVGGEQGTEYLSNIVSIAAGYWHNVAITSDGEIYTWGMGNSGRLALGDTNFRLYPCRVNNPTVGGNVEITFDHTIENSYTTVNPIDTDSDEFTLSITITNPDISDPNYIGDIDGGTLTLYLDAGCDYEWLTSFSPLVYDPNYNTASYNTVTGSVGEYVWQIGQITAGSSVTKTIDLIANQNAYPGGALDFKAVFDLGDKYTTAYHDVPVDDWATGDIIYVDSKAANRYGKGTSWDYAFVSLNKALDRAAQDPNNFNEIWVAEGLYYPTIEGSFEVPAGVEIYGGFEGDAEETQRTDRDYVKNICRLNGYGSDYVVKFIDDESNTAILDGVTITGGVTAGIYCNNASPGIYHCVIAGNGVIDYSSTYGIQLDGSDAVISDCIIANNSGAGIKSSSSGEPQISRCMIKDNGAGVDAQSLNINNSVISNNNDKGISASNGDIINCTILSNAGYGISGNTNAENNVLWANNDYGFQYDGCDITYSCIFDPNDPNSVDSTYDANYNISAYPGFLFTSYNNYVCILASNSTCIDKGSNTGIDGGDKDFYDQSRIYNNTVDMGAVEYTGDFDDIIFDLNRDAVVNYQDFVYMADTWLLESIDTGYNDDCDWIDDSQIDTDDLEEFAAAWLWQPPIFENASLAGISKWTVSYLPLTSQSIEAPVGGMMMAMQTSLPLETIPQVAIEAPQEQATNLCDNTYDQTVETIIFLEQMWNDGLLGDMTETEWLQFKQGLLSLIE